MKRGELYRVANPFQNDPKKHRAFVVVSRQTLVDSKFSTVICAPVYSVRDGLATQIDVGIDEGLKHESSVHCDGLVSLPKSTLTHYLGSLDEPKMGELDEALRIALGIE